MTLSQETLNQKRAILVAQRDQHLANLWDAVEAIAIVDELIAETVADAAREKAAALEAQRRFEEAPQPPAPAMLPVTHEAHVCTDQEYCNRFGCDHGCDK